MEHVKKIVVTVLNKAVSAYIKRNKITVIVVAGSIGKTSTANAIRTVLGQKYRVHQPKTAYNTNKSVHLEMFNMNFATSVSGWIAATIRILVHSLGRADYQMLVVEIGTDSPGEIKTFDWLKPDIGVLTAIAPEHMEQFKTIESVAKEELGIMKFCQKLVFNANMVDPSYISSEGPADARADESIIWYGKDTPYAATKYTIHKRQVRADFSFGGNRLNNLELRVLGSHSLDALVAAAAVGVECGLDVQHVKAGLEAVEPVKGRMQRLEGVHDVTIIDDSYNASPDAVKAALDVLGQFDVPQRIAVLGMMNEMGEYSPTAHRDVGSYCDPKYLDLVVTIGADANEYLAAEAAKRGCSVVRFTSPYEAGQYIKEHVISGAAVLFKGSQNGVYAEEAIKPILAHQADLHKLVRQSDYWMAKKQKQFSNVAS